MLFRDKLLIAFAVAILLWILNLPKPDRSPTTVRLQDNKEVTCKRWKYYNCGVQFFECDDNLVHNCTTNFVVLKGPEVIQTDDK